MEDSRERTPVILPRPQHPISRKLIDPDALWIMQRLRREGYLAYLVGGAVRDLLLGREPKDFDIGTNARPSEVKALFRNCRLIGRRFRLAHLYVRRRGEAEKVIEVSTFRSLRKAEEDPEREACLPEDLDATGSLFGNPEEDAWRRDFTVNALFYDLSDFSVIDHVGGLVDLDAGLIRLIGEPDERFSEDPVRMLRAVEFAVRLGFRIEEETEAGIRRNARLLDSASPARLREELRQMQQKGIMGAVLAGAHRLGFFEVLLPEVEEAEGMFPLLDLLDGRASGGDVPGEASYIAALLLPSVASRYPIAPGANLEAAHEAIAPPVEELTRRYHISGHTRHLAREYLLSCYRIARGKSYRTKSKLVRKPEFIEAWPLFMAWARTAGELNEVVDYWQAYLDGQAQPEGKRPRRRRRRPRRPRPAVVAEA
ncbi:MAG: CCA tRNA nucleotidyltransferase [Deltaproteobacteria bacterium]|nr:CCA tRNA nucleotidyltransferase [Deltaproteobacteria bacterium]